MAYEGYEKLRVGVDGGIATVTIDNPPINLFDLGLYLEMRQVATELHDDGAVRVVVLRSATPGFFIAHFDVSLIQSFPTDPAAGADGAQPLPRDVRGLPHDAQGHHRRHRGPGRRRGSELALSCDMRFAALGQAVLNQPEVALGIIPGGTGTARLGRLAGRSRALEIILGCADFDAATAERFGWVNRALPPDELWPFVDRLAARIASYPPHAVAAAKASVLRAERGVVEDLLAESARLRRHARRPLDPAGHGPLLRAGRPDGGGRVAPG